MPRTIGRRDFLKTGAGAGLTLAVGRVLGAGVSGAGGRRPVVGVAIGED